VQELYAESALLNSSSSIKFEQGKLIMTSGCDIEISLQILARNLNEHIYE
jgi:hypothetical protein